jgi:putative proteasome-type protease
MTFCLAMKVTEGLVGLADTRVTTGSERITARKVSVHQHGRHSLFLMTSGLRSLRDKALTYFTEALEESDSAFDRLYKAVNAFGAQVRRAAREDKDSLAEAGLPFDLHTLVGGQLENDAEHLLYLLYPQGNWVEVSRGTPYFVIGETSYGKPLLDRALRSDTGIEAALKMGVLAFDATRASSTEVDFPIDVVLYRRDSYTMVEHRYERRDLAHISDWWQDRVCRSVEELPAEWVTDLLSKLPAS